MPHCDRRFTIGLSLAALGAFLRSRRARLTPCAVGLPNVGRRRTAGLRREEVAQLAGISPAWYTHLEQGRDVHPSRAVLGAVADALRLDATERAYLFQLAYGTPADAQRAANCTRSGTPPSARPTVRAVALRPTPDTPDGTPRPIRRLLDALGPVPALVIDGCWDVVGRNAALAAVLPGLGPERTGPDTPPRNVVAFVLTSVAWRAVVRDWTRVARMAVAGLRWSLPSILAEHPDDPRVATILGTLERDSPEFRAWWPAHGLWVADEPVTHVYAHPRVGWLEFEVTLLDVRSAPGLTLVTYTPCDAGTAERLQQLTAGNTRCLV